MPISQADLPSLNAVMKITEQKKFERLVGETKTPLYLPFEGDIIQLFKAVPRRTLVTLRRCRHLNQVPE